MENYKFFSNKKCEYYPCHVMTDGSDINCLFCYCPLYALGDKCGGNFSYTEKGIKNCSNCNKPHGKDGYEHVMSNIKNLLEIAKKE